MAKELLKGLSLKERALIYTFLLFIIVVAFWEAPLFLEPASNLRYALEELRVLLFGMSVGAFLLFFYQHMLTKGESEK